MGTKIEWAKETWNPITGCTKIGIECQNCYAQQMTLRLKGRFGYPKDNPFQPGVFHPLQLDKPYKLRKPCMIFVTSMGDLFHEHNDLSHIDKVFDVIQKNPRHIFIILTKRPKLMGYYFFLLSKNLRQIMIDLPLRHVWIGVTAGSNLPSSLERLDILSGTIFKGWTRFVSVEPMLSLVDLSPYIGWLDWVICGAETGRNARSCKLEWVRNLRNQCVVAGVPFFFKKFADGNRGIDGQVWEQMPADL